MKHFTRRSIVRGGAALLAAPAIIGKAKAGLLLAPTTGGPPPSFSHPHAIAETTDSNNVTIPAIDTTGINLLIFCASTFGSTFTQTDSVGTNWASPTNAYQATQGSFVADLSYQNAPTTSASYTATLTSTGTSPTISIVGLPGFTGSSTETQNSTTGSATNALPSLASAAGNMLFCFIMHNSSANPTIDSGFTIIDAQPNVTGVGMATAFLIGASSAAPTWTFTGSPPDTAAILVNFSGTFTP